MERGEQKPDLSGRVNGLDISIFRRDSGVEISVEQEGKEVVLFRYSPQGTNKESNMPTFPAAPVPSVSASPLPLSSPAPERVTTTQPETRTPLKVVGTVEGIEGMGETPNTHEPVFRFSVRWVNAKTSVEEVRQIATFRQIAQTLNQFYTSSDPAVKLQSGRQISMIAWEHGESASLYPSSVNYLHFPTITNPKTQKRR